MKNLYLLPTDKPSRLHLIEDFLMITNEYKNSACDTEANIYITSDEEIKEGDWYYYFGHIVKYDSDENTLTPNCKKIILTTDQDLIKDGVQAIDDDFLEWFVKNPSCEEVEVNHFGMCCSNQLIAQCINCNQYNPVYKIIIPKEESKQETLDEVAEIGKFAEKKYLERLDNFQKIDFKDGVFEGAKWQAERMYSEEEVQIILSKLLFDLKHKGISNSVEWFEQFKKK